MKKQFIPYTIKQIDITELLFKEELKYIIKIPFPLIEIYSSINRNLTTEISNKTKLYLRHGK